MHPITEAWARFCALNKATPRCTLEYKIARYEMVSQVLPSGKRCEVCGGWLQLGYKVLLPTEQPRAWNVGYIHTAPEWCERALAAEREVAYAHD